LIFSAFIIELSCLYNNHVYAIENIFHANLSGDITGCWI